MKEFNGFNWRDKEIKLDAKGKLFIEGMPIEVHFKSNGTADGRPSLAFVIVFADEAPIIAACQISIDMFNEGCKDIGYKLVKIEENETDLSTKED